MMHVIIVLGDIMFVKILDSCKYVVANAEHVRISIAKIDELAKDLYSIKDIHWLQSSPYGILDLSIEEIVNFLLLYHSIGFSYWGNPKWTVETKDGELDGAFAMLYVLINEIKNNTEFLKPSYLQNLTRIELKRILKGNVEIPLFDERYSNIINMAKTINTNMNGDFYDYIKNINNDEELFKVLIDNFEYFNDVSIYKNKKVYFYKLAQLLTSDILHIRVIKEKANVNYTHLLGCADYKIPQVMRNLGILEYSSELERIVNNKEVILKNSNYEIEIRASVMVVIDIINRRTLYKFCPIMINDYIWLMGQDSSNKLLPYHLTRTNFY